LRVVFDTNVFVSALVFPGGRADQALRRIIHGRDELVSSKELLHELLDVLARKFSRNPDQLARVAIFLSEVSELVEPAQGLSVLEDDADNRVLECALAGRADLIVTGDRAMLALGGIDRVRIVGLADYLDCRTAP
jgi:putative PIN family toxin of toxin-antitoxin system